MHAFTKRPISVNDLYQIRTSHSTYISSNGKPVIFPQQTNDSITEEEASDIKTIDGWFKHHLKQGEEP